MLAFVVASFPGLPCFICDHKDAQAQKREGMEQGKAWVKAALVVLFNVTLCIKPCYTVLHCIIYISAVLLLLFTHQVAALHCVMLPEHMEGKFRPPHLPVLASRFLDTCQV